MKECLNCGAMNANDADVCSQDCGPPLGNFGPIESDAASNVIALPSAPASAPPPPPPATGFEAFTKYPPPPPPPQRDEAEQAPPPPPQYAESEARSQTFLEELRSLTSGARRPRIIFMFGFSSSGKSFFIVRSKDDNTGLNYVEIEPLLPEARTAEEEHKGIELPSTKGIELHTYSNKNDTVILVDVEGERFRIAAQDKFVGVNRMFLEAVAHADGFVFMLPAAETLLPKYWEREHEDMANKAEARGEAHPFRTARQRVVLLRNNINRITQFLQFVTLQRRGVSDARKSEATAQEAVEKYLRLTPTQLQALRQSAHTRSDRPALVLLSKADEYQKLAVKYAPSGYQNGWRTHFDGDPMGRLAECEEVGARLLIKGFEQSFKRFRVDFVTAFAEHEQFPDRDPGLQNIRYDLTRDHFGVKSNFRWLVNEIDNSRRRLLGRFDYGVGPAIALRKFVDPNFRRVWSDQD